VAGGEFFAVDGPQLVLQGAGGRESVGNGIGIGEGVDIHRLDRCNVNRTDAGYVAALPGPHVAEFPQPDRLRLFAGADRGQEFLLEEEHIALGEPYWSLK
jgi:hypothetical protein